MPPDIPNLHSRTFKPSLRRTVQLLIHKQGQFQPTQSVTMAFSCKQQLRVPATRASSKRTCTVVCALPKPSMEKASLAAAAAALLLVSTFFGSVCYT
jgi:hypothetical protein